MANVCIKLYIYIYLFCHCSISRVEQEIVCFPTFFFFLIFGRKPDPGDECQSLVFL